MPRLEVELVPSTAWWSNVRSNVSKADWEKCKKLVRRRSGDKCEICGGVGKRWPVECHETWMYDDERQVQTLVGLIALCPSCHETKHIGRAAVMGNMPRAIEHLMKVNRWSAADAERYLEVVFEIHALRSTWEWALDITFLSLLDIHPDPSVMDRQPPPPKDVTDLMSSGLTPRTTAALGYGGELGGRGLRYMAHSLAKDNRHR